MEAVRLICSNEWVTATEDWAKGESMYCYPRLGHAGYASVGAGDEDGGRAWLTLPRQIFAIRQVLRFTVCTLQARRRVERLHKLWVLTVRSFCDTNMNSN